MLPSAAYSARVSAGALRFDAKQKRVLEICFDRIHRDIEGYSSRKASRSTLSSIPGLYLYGGVGCGKTYIMDLFQEGLPRSVSRRRVHFHSFMIEAHKQIHDVKRTDRKTDGIAETTRRLVADAEVLCFDEVMVTDIADAMVLKRLFQSFYDLGICVVATSNRKPEDLYLHGLNRETFLPFISMVRKRNEVHDMDSATDYRLLGSSSGVYYAPITSDNRTKFLHRYEAMCKGVRPTRKSHLVMGREVDVPSAVDGVCKFTFAELCATERSSVDYQEIASHYHTLFLEDMPRLSLNQTAEVRRFIVALDMFYQHRVKVIVLAEASPEDICDRDGGSGSVVDKVMADALGIQSTGVALFDNSEERFMVDRAVSRLTEMRSVEYLEKAHLSKA